MPAIVWLGLLLAAAAPDAGTAPAPSADGGAPPPFLHLELPPAPEGVAARRLDFRAGAPLVPVRLMEGHLEVTLSSRSRLRFRLAGAEERVVEGPPRAEWRVRRERGRPAVVVARIQVAELRFDDKEGLQAAREEWTRRGLPVKALVLGGVYGIAGKVIDNRRYALVVDQPPAPPASLAPRQAEILAQHQVRTTLLEELRSPAQVTLELLDADGVSQGLSDGQVLAEAVDGAPVEVRRVEHGVGYEGHGFEDRSYRGAILLTGDRQGKLAVVNQVDLEDLLKGLVPSEIYARAHPEALKAQAVTARGEVLAKVGLKHLADPYLLCTEQHCAVYKGVSGEAAATSAAVEATRGEAAFDAQGRLVDSVYSAICGGHTEDNEVVWGGVANPSLRGRPDLLPGADAGVRPDQLHAFLASPAPFACRVSSFAQPGKFRWERRFSAREVDERLAGAGLGRVMAMTVTERGVSGRARLLQVSGEQGATTLRGELTIRRTFGMLNSALFELTVERDARGRPQTWVFSGGGWGHGVGLCQTGAIGRAEAGQDYRRILDHYFNGAVVAPLY